MLQFIKGQRVEYIDGSPNAYKSMIGAKGTVSNDTVSNDSRRIVEVVWDDPHPYNQHSPAFLKPVFTQDEVEKALAILKVAGTVTFKPFKPPFKPIEVWVAGYSASIGDNGVVSVGCKNIPFAVVDQIAAAVAKARAYADAYV